MEDLNKQLDELETLMRAERDAAVRASAGTPSTLLRTILFWAAVSAVLYSVYLIFKR
jgi:hypothetical protein